MYAAIVSSVSKSCSEQEEQLFLQELSPPIFRAIILLEVDDIRLSYACSVGKAVRVFFL